MENAKFTILVPVYNAANYLDKCISSILNQSYFDFELILINDGSCDNSLDICRFYETQDQRIRVIDKENGGSTSARKLGAKFALGQFIVCVDADDFLDEDYLRCFDKYIDDSTDIVCSGYKNFKKEKVFNAISPGVYSSVDVFKEFMVSSKLQFPNFGCISYSLWAKCIRTSLFKKHQNTIPDNIIMGEDLLLLSKIIKDSKTVAITDDCLYNYRFNEESITNQFNYKKHIMFANTCAELLNEYYDKNKVYLYAKNFLISMQIELVKHSNSFKGFKRNLVLVDMFNDLKNYSDKAVIKKARLKNKIKYILDKYNLFLLMYLFYKN